MIISMAMRRLRISRGGQVSVPAEVRRRWNTSRVTLEDRGDELVIRPAPEDPISALRGAFAGPGPTSEELRARARAEERAIEERKLRALGLDP